MNIRGGGEDKLPVMQEEGYTQTNDSPTIA